jgi:hypothetical protein
VDIADQVPVSDLTIDIPPPGDILDELEKTLEQIVEETRKEAEMHDRLLGELNGFQQSMVYTGAVMNGVWETGKDLGGMAVSGLESAGQFLDGISPGGMMADAWNGRMPGTTAYETITETGEAIVDGTKAAAKTVSEAWEVLDALRQDPRVWAVLEKFVEDYTSAIHSMDITEAVGSEVLLAIVTGGVGLAVKSAQKAKLLAKASQQIAKLRELSDPKFLRRLKTELGLLLSQFTRRYLNMPHIKAHIKRIGNSPTTAAALWAPMLRPAPFFGVSQSFERSLHPGVLTALEEVRPQAYAALGKEGVDRPEFRHGSCAEPVAISRALKFLNRGGTVTTQHSVAGSFMVTINILLAGQKRKNRPGKKGLPKGSYSADNPDIHPHARYGEKMAACGSCRELLRFFGIIDLYMGHDGANRPKKRK